MPESPPEAVVGGLTAAEAAARLGVKRQTLYAYVSRGLLTRTLADDGRTSRFDPAEIDRLLTDRRPSAEGELRTVIATGLTRVADQGLLVRGHDLVQLVAEEDIRYLVLECARFDAVPEALVSIAYRNADYCIAAIEARPG